MIPPPAPGRSNSLRPLVCPEKRYGLGFAPSNAIDAVSPVCPGDSSSSTLVPVETLAKNAAFDNNFPSESGRQNDIQKKTIDDFLEFAAFGQFFPVGL